MIGARVVARLELSLGDGRLERDVPQPRCLLLVGLAALQVAQERLLRDGARALVDRAVLHVPVDADAEAAEECLEGLLVLDGEHVAQLDEVLSPDRLLVGGLDALALGALERRGVVLDVGLRRVAAHAVVVLDATLRRQAVVVPTDRVEDLAPLHALVARHAVGVGVAEHVPDVQAARCGRRGSVDGEDLLARQLQGALAVERVRAAFLPYLAPDVLEAVDGGLVGHRAGAGRRLLGWGGVGSHGVIFPCLTSWCDRRRRGGLGATTQGRGPRL